MTRSSGSAMGVRRKAASICSFRMRFRSTRIGPVAERLLMPAYAFDGWRDLSFLPDGDEIPEMSKLHCHIQFNINFPTFILYLVFLRGGINLCFESIYAPVVLRRRFPTA